MGLLWILGPGKLSKIGLCDPVSRFAIAPLTGGERCYEKLNLANLRCSACDE